MSRSKRSGVRPTVESMEGRRLLSVSALLVRSAQLRQVAAQHAAKPTVAAGDSSRTAFIAQFKGAYIIGPGRSSDQSSVIYFNGGGTSNKFLHGDIQMNINRFKDGSPADGAASLPVKNVTNTGNQLQLDLSSPTATDAKGRPTEFAWTVNTGGGTFTNATGQGTVKIVYQPDAKPPRRGMESGKFGVTFTGRVVTTGINDLTRG